MEEVFNFYHPLHELFTLEYGWMPMDRLYEKFANNEKLHIAQFDMDSMSFPYTTDYSIIYNVVRSCTYEFGRNKDSNITYNVQPYCHVLCSLDGGDTIEFVSARDIHKTQQDGYIVKVPNMQTIYDLQRNVTDIRMEHGALKRNYRFNNGLTYGIVNQTGSVISRYKGRYTVLQCYIKGEYIE